MVLLQGNDAESLEQSLNTYAELLKELNQKSIPRMRPNEQATVTIVMWLMIKLLILHAMT